ncbi:hypothetical protein ACFLQK_03010, partial [bacterium]
EELLATRFPPEMHDWSIDPEEPAEGDVVTINVEIYNPADLTDDETTEVYVLFSVDFGESWDYIEMETDDDKNWTGELGEFESGDEVIFAIRAVDTSSNVFTTVPCMATMDYEMDPEFLIDGDCVHSGDMESCEDFMPRGCLMRMAVDDDPLDDDEENIQAYGDYVDYRIGYNEDYTFMDLVVEGEVDGGTMTPTDIHLYAGLIINPDEIGGDSSIEALLTAGGVFVFAPQLKQFESTGYVSDCFFGFNQGGEFGMDKKNIKCLDKENHLIFRIDNELLGNIGDNESGVYQFLAITGQVTDVSDFNNIQGGPLDINHVTAAHFTEETWFEVQ